MEHTFLGLYIKAWTNNFLADIGGWNFYLNTGHCGLVFCTLKFGWSDLCGGNLWCPGMGCCYLCQGIPW